MNRFVSLRTALTALALASACTMSTPAPADPGDDPPTKEEARAHGGKSDGGEDWCILLGWYGDGVCDDFCPRPDPDCGAACPDPSDPSVHYIGNAEECSTILFACADGQTHFTNECGCGCIDDAPAPPLPPEPPPACPDPADPRVRYFLDSHDDPSVCLAAVIAPECSPGAEYFFSEECGCGCIEPEPAECPDPADPRVHYLGDSHENPSYCLAIYFACEEGQTAFSDECGCGCIDP